MIKLFYTGASSENQDQPSRALSLGARPSLTLLPNGTDNNIFSNLQIFSKYNKRETICLALLNDSNSAVTGVTVSLTFSSLIFKGKIAAQAPSIDNCNLPYFQLLSSSQELPVGLTFTEHTSSNPLSLGQLAANQLIALWLVREITPTGVSQIDAALDCNGVKGTLLDDLKQAIEFSLEIGYN